MAPLRLRDTQRMRGLQVVILVLGTLVVFMAVLIRRSHPSLASQVFEFGLLCPAAAFLILATWRSTRVGMEVDGDAVVIRNWWSTRHLSRAEVTEVGLVKTGLGWITALVLTDGNHVRMEALGGYRYEELLAKVRKLERALGLGECQTATESPSVPEPLSDAAPAP